MRKNLTEGIMLENKKIKADFCVIGGGMAGLSAAVAASRHGLRTVLMQERPVLGGNASSEIRMWLCGARGEDNRETGIVEEIALENLYRNPTKNYYIWDTVLYDFARREKNLTLLLNCTCMDARVEKGSYADGRKIRICKVTGYQMTTQTFLEVEAGFFADCSGDSILAPLTGAEYRTGRESTAEFGEETYVREPDNCTMGMSCLLQGRETGRPVRFIPPEWSSRLCEEDFADRLGDPRDTAENFWYLELGGDRNSIRDTEEVASELIPLALGTWDHIKNSGRYDCATWDLDFLGFLPGKRESRRMMGEYVVTQKDISAGRDYPDTVAYGGWPLDDHFPGGFFHKGIPNTNVSTPAPYPLPYRALYSRNVENLFFAGRNISVTHFALSSVRVMNTCALFGQAAGTAAALAVKKNLTPHGVYREALKELQQTLLADDVFLPGVTREISDLCRRASLLGGSGRLRDGMDREHNILYKGRKCGDLIKNGSAVRYCLEEESYVESVHLVFDSDLNRRTLAGDSTERDHNMRANVLLDSPQTGLPGTLCRSFILRGGTQERTREFLRTEDNRKRAWEIPIGCRVEFLELTVMGNWGDTEKTAVFSFDFR